MGMKLINIRPANLQQIDTNKRKKKEITDEANRKNKSKNKYI